MKKYKIIPGRLHRPGKVQAQVKKDELEQTIQELKEGEAIRINSTQMADARKVVARIKYSHMERDYGVERKSPYKGEVNRFEDVGNIANGDTSTTSNGHQQ